MNAISEVIKHFGFQLVGLAQDPDEVQLEILHRGKLQAILVLENEAWEEGNHQAFWREKFVGSRG